MRVYKKASISAGGGTPQDIDNALVEVIAGNTPIPAKARLKSMSVTQFMGTVNTELVFEWSDTE